MAKIIKKSATLVKVVDKPVLVRVIFSLIYAGFGYYFVYPIFSLKMGRGGANVGFSMVSMIFGLFFLYKLFMTIFINRGKLIDTEQEQIVDYGRFLGIKYRNNIIPFSSLKRVVIVKEIKVVQKQNAGCTEHIFYKVAINGRKYVDVDRSPEHHEMKHIAFKIAKLVGLEVHDLSMKKKKVYDREFVQKAIV